MFFRFTFNDVYTVDSNDAYLQNKSIFLHFLKNKTKQKNKL